MRNLISSFNVSKKKLVIVIIAALCLGYFFYRVIPHKPTLPPRTVVDKAVNSTLRAKSYSYQIEMKTVVNGKEGSYTDIKGWREGNKSIHIQGRIMNSEIEFYQIEDTTYTKDQMSGKWIKIVDNQLNQEEIFAAELNPLANFNYEDLTEVIYEGIVEERGKKVWKYTARPIVNNPYLEILWQDFVYELWIDRGSNVLTKATVEAVSKRDSKDKLVITVLFDEYGSNFDIKAPI